MKKLTTMLDFFKRKDSKSSKVNMGLPTTNFSIPILENIDSPIPENVNVPIPRNIHSPIPENADIPIPKNNHIFKTQFQKVDFDILRNNDFWLFVLIDSLLILYGCIWKKKKKKLLISSPQLEILGLALSLRA